MSDYSPKIPVTEGMAVIGCDPSSTKNCGWSVVRFEGGKPVLLFKQTQTIDRAQDDNGRYRDIYDFLADLAAKHGAKVLCIERSMGGGLQFVRNNLSETVGACKLCSHDKGIYVYETSPAHLKKVIAGHGRAKKQHIKANVVATFGLAKAGPEHECDAAACALSYFIDAGWAGYEVKVPFVPEPK